MNERKYDEAATGTLKMLPPEYRIAALQSDYANMREMFFGPPYYQKTRLTFKNCGSRGFPIVVVQHSTEFFSALDVTPYGKNAHAASR